MFSGLSVYTQIHVLISVIAIVSGLMVLQRFFTQQQVPWLTAVFLWTTLATSLTGFGFLAGPTPAFATGVIATVVVVLAFVALYAKHLAGGWRRVYVITAVVSLYLNVFVLVVQLFLKVPSLHALAPQGKEPPFAITQGIVLVLFVVAGFGAVRRYK